MAGLAGIALFLMTMRNVKDANQHLITSMEVLIIMSFPVIAGLEFLMSSDIGQSLFGGGIAIFAIFWLLYFIMKKGKDEDENKDIKNARPQIIIVFIMLISFSVIAFASIETFQDILKKSLM